MPDQAMPPQRPGAGKRPGLRESVRMFLQHRGISIRNRRQREHLSVTLVILSLIMPVALFISWGWFRDEALPWINMGRSRAVFLVALVVALVVWLLFVINLVDLRRARRQSREKSKAEEQ